MWPNNASKNVKNYRHHFIWRIRQWCNEYYFAQLCSLFPIIRRCDSIYYYNAVGVLSMRPWGPVQKKSTRGQLFVLFPQKRRVTASVGNPGARAQCRRSLYSIEVPTFLRILKSWLSLFPLRYRWASVAYNEPCKGCYHNLCWISRAYKGVSDVWACSSCYYIGV